MAAVCLLAAVCVVLAAAPVQAAAAPPQPRVASHGEQVRAAYIGHCPNRRPRGEPWCAIPAHFITTKPVPVHQGGLLTVHSDRRARGVRLDLNCGHRRVASPSRRRWRFEITGAGCTHGSLHIRYTSISAVYTFSLKRHVHCQPTRSKTISENGFARLYSIERLIPGDGSRDLETSFYGCRLDSGRSHMLGRDYCGGYYSGCDYLDHAVLAGEKVAYVAGFEDYRHEPRRHFTLAVLDTAGFTSERRYEVRTPTPDGYERDVTALVLKSNGSIAWILYRVDWQSERVQTYEVLKSDTGADSAVLDSGADIDPQSLSLNGSTLTWKRAGEDRSASLD